MKMSEPYKFSYAEKLKSCTEIFFESVNKEYAAYILGKLGSKENPIHFSDIEYRDGYYYAFGSGPNSKVHFHIDECPGWLFGIWWHVPENLKTDKPFINGEFFAQYEDTIDKFRPSRTDLCVTISVKDQVCYGYPATKMIAFIRNEPYLAFCRDYCGWNYNVEYRTREEAKAMFDKYKEKHETEEKYTKEYDEKIITFVSERILPMYAGAKIEDYGEYCSPRYAVVAPLKGNEQFVDERGLYGWCDEEEEEGKKITEDFKALVKECNKISRDLKVFWSCPIHDTITFYDPEE